jgi:exodeoxyribonuclease VII small subunit
VSAAPTPGPATGPAPEGELSYEQARAELEEVVRRLETGGVPLEESLALWERGEALAAQCQAWLDGARRRMQAVRDAGPGPAERARADSDPQS